MKKNKLNIAILGANSHIAKGLIYYFLRDEKFQLSLFTRNKEKTENFLAEFNSGSQMYSVTGYENFEQQDYDCIINCVGVGTIDKLEGEYSRYFTVTEEFDNKCINYLLKNPDAVYISLSSGVVYGKDYSKPYDENTVREINVNQIDFTDYYSIARLNAEAKHRSFTNLKIVDLRICNYFSRFIDLTDRYFITDVINSIREKKTLKTNDLNIVRDYLSPQDLFSAMQLCIELKTNSVFDISSLKPVSKNEILEEFSKRFNLKYEIENKEVESGTGSKNIYYSENRNALQLGYKAGKTSMENLIEETEQLLKMSGKNIE